jgi:hypothetical protein
LGDDILAGNSLAIIGLYKSIYGVNPLYNRLYLNPHIPEKISGTELLYNFRDDKLKIGLSIDKYYISNNQFKITTSEDFGFFSTNHELKYFHGKDDNHSLKVQTSKKISIEIIQWNNSSIAWNQSSSDENANEITYEVNNLEPKTFYSIFINNNFLKNIESESNGSFSFNIKSNKISDVIKIIKK